MESPIYNQLGKKVGTVSLPESIFGMPFKYDLVHQVLVSLQANKRAGTAHSKGRSDVSGGGRKPWQQKGTGRARHGSRRSPLWRGGGVTFGPTKERVWSQKVNKKAKAKAFVMLLAQKFRDGEILFVDHLAISSGKTKDAKGTLADLGGISGFEKLLTKKKNAALVCLSQKDTKTMQSLKNFGNIFVTPVSLVNPLHLATYTHVIVSEPESAIASFAKKIGTTESKKVEK